MTDAATWKAWAEDYKAQRDELLEMLDILVWGEWDDAWGPWVEKRALVTREFLDGARARVAELKADA